VGGWGGIVAAHTYAVGGTVFAAQANTAAANAFIDGHWFFQLVQNAWRVALWTSFLTWLPPLLLIGWQLRRRKAVL